MMMKERRKKAGREGEKEGAEWLMHRRVNKGNSGGKGVRERQIEGKEE